MPALLGCEPADLAVDGPGMSARAAAEKCRAALWQMSEAERLVFVLYEMKGLSGQEIAETDRLSRGHRVAPAPLCPS